MKRLPCAGFISFVLRGCAGLCLTADAIAQSAPPAPIPNRDNEVILADTGGRRPSEISSVTVGRTQRPLFDTSPASVCAPQTPATSGT